MLSPEWKRLLDQYEEHRAERRRTIIDELDYRGGYTQPMPSFTEESSTETVSYTSTAT